MKRTSLAKRGGAWLALPLLLWMAAPAPATIAVLEEEAPHLDGSAMLILGKAETFTEVPTALRFPAPSTQLWLYGAGAGFSKGPLRAGVQALQGSLSARQGDLATEWRVNLAQVVLEQRYPYGSLLMTAGTLVDYAQMEGLLSDGGKITRYDGSAYGGGLVGGLRWPRQTRLGFVGRGGYLWLPVTGTWKGDLASLSPRSAFELGGPFTQLQIELSF